MKKNKLTQTEKIWIVELLFLLLKNIRFFRQKQNIEEQIEVYCELTQIWKDKLDADFDFNFFLLPLTKSKVYFNSSEKGTDKNFYHLADLRPFGALKFFIRPETTKQAYPNTKKQTLCLKNELQKKLKYFEKEFKRSQNLLTNKNFVQKAPIDLVESERKKLIYFAEQKKKIMTKIQKT